jgi:hypothetical protein
MSANGQVEDEPRLLFLILMMGDVVVLIVGIIAGVVHACRQRREASDSRRRDRVYRLSEQSLSVFVTGAIIVGLFGLGCASIKLFIHGNWHKGVPPLLNTLTFVDFPLLLISPVISGIGLRFRDRPQVHEAFRRAGHAVFVGGLALGLATWVVLDLGEDEEVATQEWREGCKMLGASSGQLLLALLAATNLRKVATQAVPQQDEVDCDNRRVMEPEEPVHIDRAVFSSCQCTSIDEPFGSASSQGAKNWPRVPRPDLSSLLQPFIQDQRSPPPQVDIPHATYYEAPNPTAAWGGTCRGGPGHPIAESFPNGRAALHPVLAS